MDEISDRIEGISELHILKTWPDPFQAVWDGRKPYEIRKADRDFRVGDQIQLMEYSPNWETYSGRYVIAFITYITPPGKWDLPEGVCVLGLGSILRSADFQHPHIGEERMRASFDEIFNEIPDMNLDFTYDWQKIYDPATSTEDSIDEVFNTMDDLYLASYWDLADEAIRNVDVTRVYHLSTLLGFLSITYPKHVADNLPSRPDLVKRVEAEVDKRAPHRKEKLIGNLREPKEMSFRFPGITTGDF